MHMFLWIKYVFPFTAVDQSGFLRSIFYLPIIWSLISDHKMLQITCRATKICILTLPLSAFELATIHMMPHQWSTHFRLGDAWCATPPRKTSRWYRGPMSSVPSALVDAAPPYIAALRYSLPGQRRPAFLGNGSSRSIELAISNVRSIEASDVALKYPAGSIDELWSLNLVEKSGCWVGGRHFLSRSLKQMTSLTFGVRRCRGRRLRCLPACSALSAA